MERVEHWCAGIDHYQWNGSWFDQARIAAVQEIINSFKPHQSDVVLCSYPKTGTTWLKALIFSILNRHCRCSASSSDPLDFLNPHELAPILEFQIYVPRFESPAAYFPVECSRRFFSTHVPFRFLADNVLSSSGTKVVYVTRNPKDTLVSYWHFANAIEGSDKDPWHLETAVRQFCDGAVLYGPYYDHVLEYRKLSLERPHQVFFITYEQLKEDTVYHVKRLAQFLECPFEDSEKGEEEAKEIVSKCSFKELSNKGVNKSKKLPSWAGVPYSSYFRKGQIRDYENYLSPDMVRRIDAVTQQKFHGSGFRYGI